MNEGLPFADKQTGFEGLSASADGKTLYVLLQAAANQEGGLTSQTERHTRFLEYDVSNRLSPVYVAEYVVPLPLYTDPTAKASKNPKVAAQSEVHALPNGQFFVLARDSGFGHGQDGSLSNYRHIDVFDVSNATDVSGAYDCETCAVATEGAGVLDADVVPAALCPFLDFNVNAQLNRFGVHNGGDQDAGLLVSDAYASFLPCLPLNATLSTTWHDDEPCHLAKVQQHSHRPTQYPPCTQANPRSNPTEREMGVHRRRPRRPRAPRRQRLLRLQPERQRLHHTKRLPRVRPVPVRRLERLQPRQPGPCVQSHTAVIGGRRYDYLATARIDTR